MPADVLDIQFPVGNPHLPSGTTITVLFNCRKCKRQEVRKIWVQCLGDERAFICIMCKTQKVMSVRPKLLTHIPMTP